MTELQVFRDGQKRAAFIEPLKDGDAGVIQELQIMRDIVRYDATQPDLRKFILRYVLGKRVRGHDYAGEVRACFDFAQRGIVYRRDPVGVERIADLWSALYALSPDDEPEGDCVIKSVCLATCLALLGHYPFFVVMKQSPQDQTFKHVYVGVPLNGKKRALDPTPEETPMGFEAKSFQRVEYPIF
jgi:hypothetical protein